MDALEAVERLNHSVNCAFIGRDFNREIEFRDVNPPLVAVRGPVTKTALLSRKEGQYRCSSNYVISQLITIMKKFPGTQLEDVERILRTLVSRIYLLALRLPKHAQHYGILCEDNLADKEALFVCMNGANEKANILQKLGIKSGSLNEAGCACIDIETMTLLGISPLFEFPIDKPVKDIYV
jgi:hypothetical protein